MRYAVLLLAGISLLGCSSHATDTQGAGGHASSGSVMATASSGMSTSSGGGGSGGFPGGGSCVPDTDGGGGCAGANLFFNLNIDDGTPKHFALDCALTGRLISGGGPVPPPGPPGPFSGGLLQITANATQSSEFALLSATIPSLPGSTTAAYARYFQSGSEYSTPKDDATVTITSFTIVGEVIEGSYSATVTRTYGDAGSNMASVQGDFRVCRSPDEILP